MPFHVPAVTVLKDAFPKLATPMKLEVPVTERAVMVVVAKLPVEGVEAPIGVLLMLPPVMVAPDELKVFAVKSPLIVVVENVAAP